MRLAASPGGVPLTASPRLPCLIQVCTVPFTIVDYFSLHIVCLRFAHSQLIFFFKTLCLHKVYTVHHDQTFEKIVCTKFAEVYHVYTNFMPNLHKVCNQSTFFLGEKVGW
jgi:hypothetical protein